MTIGCLTISLDRKGGISAAVLREGGIAATAGRIGSGIISLAERFGEGIAVATRRKGWISVAVGLVCGVDIGAEYGIIWASDGKLITLEGGYLIGAPEPE